MSALEVTGIVACVFGLLAIVAWASAWKTMEWLADAEDLIEAYRDADGEGWHAEAVSRLLSYRRRTPRRST